MGLQLLRPKSTNEIVNQLSSQSISVIYDKTCQVNCTNLIETVIKLFIFFTYLTLNNLTI